MQDVCPVKAKGSILRSRNWDQGGKPDFRTKKQNYISGLGDKMKIGDKKRSQECEEARGATGVEVRNLGGCDQQVPEMQGGL